MAQAFPSRKALTAGATLAAPITSLKEDRFNAPKEPGVYYYGISAFWTRADGKSTEGDTSVVFSIEVKA